MDKRLAALHPEIADQVQFERLSETISKETVLEPPLPARIRARQALLNVGNQILGETESENEQRAALLPRLYGGSS